MRTVLLSVILTAFAWTAPAAAQSIAGTWDAEMSTPGGVRTFQIVLQVDGNKLSGTVKRSAGDVPLAGTIKGDTVTFTYSINYNDHPLDLTVTAIVAGDLMKGTVDMGGVAQDAFSAKRATAPPARP
jgi:hypothetical protein